MGRDGNPSNIAQPFAGNVTSTQWWEQPSRNPKTLEVWQGCKFAEADETHVQPGDRHAHLDIGHDGVLPLLGGFAGLGLFGGLLPAVCGLLLVCLLLLGGLLLALCLFGVLLLLCLLLLGILLSAKNYRCQICSHLLGILPSVYILNVQVCFLATSIMASSAEDASCRTTGMTPLGLLGVIPGMPCSQSSERAD